MQQREEAASHQQAVFFTGAENSPKMEELDGWMENSPRFPVTVSNRSHLPQDRSLKVMQDLHGSFSFLFFF